MQQQNYRRTLDLDAAPATVYAALTTSAGVRGWWSEACSVSGETVGSELQFRFGRNYKHFLIERLETAREVVWLCVRAHIAQGELTRRDEWVGTRVVFRLLPLADGRTRLTFEHVGLTPELECYGMCNDGWNYFLASMEQFVATGRGTPFPKTPVAEAA